MHFMDESNYIVYWMIILAAITKSARNENISPNIKVATSKRKIASNLRVCILAKNFLSFSSESSPNIRDGNSPEFPRK